MEMSDFTINEDYVPTCAILTKNPYKAVSRLVRENFRGRGSEGAFGRSQVQTSITWGDYPQTKEVRRLGKREQWTLFPKAEWPPWQGKMKTWITHHMNEWNDALGWTPQMINEWLAVYGDAKLLIELSRVNHFSPKEDLLVPVVSYADLSSGSSSRQSLQQARSVSPSLVSVYPHFYPTPGLSPRQSLHENNEIPASPVPVLIEPAFETPPYLAMLGAQTDPPSYDSIHTTSQTSLHGGGPNCSCLECQEDREFAEAMAQSAQQFIDEMHCLQVLEDEIYARDLTEEENGSRLAAENNERERLAQDRRIATYYTRHEQRKAEESSRVVREQIEEDLRLARELERLEDENYGRIF